MLYNLNQLRMKNKIFLKIFTLNQTRKLKMTTSNFNNLNLTLTKF